MVHELKDESLFWKKKEFISFILSILVFFIHISSIAQYGNSDTVVSIMNDKVSFFFTKSITAFAVPMFFILSGIAFFKDYNNTKYLKKIRSRVFTLVIPYLIWNTVWMLFDIFCSYSFLSNYFSGRKPFTLTFVNVCKAIFLNECNGPFWFVFNLIIFSAAAPLIYCVIRNKYFGILSVIALTVLGIFEIQIPESVFTVSTSIIFYLIGAIIGKHFFGCVSKKSDKTTQLCSVAFLSTYVILKNIFGIQADIFKFVWDVIVFTLSAFALWNITDIFIHKIKPRKIYSRSFAIFALHINTSAIIAKLIFLCLPKSEWMAIPNFIITVILTLSAINLFCSLLERFLPKVYSVIMGNRLKKS